MISYLDTTAKRVASALGIDPHYARWEKIEPVQGEGLVLYLPWARVVVARSASGAERFIQTYRTSTCPWLVDSIEAAYPHARTAALYPERLLEFSISDKKLAGFVRWGVKVQGKASWPVAPGIRVIGSWSTYRDAVLVRQLDGRCTLRQRLTATSGGLHGNRESYSKADQSPPAKMDQLGGRSLDSGRWIPPVANLA
jgi:hypothetical protein